MMVDDGRIFIRMSGFRAATRHKSPARSIHPVPFDRDRLWWSEKGCACGRGSLKSTPSWKMPNENYENAGSNRIRTNLGHSQCRKCGSTSNMLKHVENWWKYTEIGSVYLSVASANVSFASFCSICTSLLQAAAWTCLAPCALILVSMAVAP